MSDPQPFRLVHVIPHLRGPAAESVVHLALAQAAQLRGEVAVALSADTDDPWSSSPVLIDTLRDGGVAVHTCGNFFTRDLAGLAEAAQALRARVGRDDWTEDAVAHAHTAMAAVVARRAGVPRVVASMHGSARRRPPEFDLQDDLAWRLCDTLIVASERLASRWRHERALHTLVAVPPVTLAARVDRSARQASVPRVAYVGDLTVEHTPELLIEAMPTLWARCPDVELRVIGPGDHAATLRALARDVDPDGSRIAVSTDGVDVGELVAHVDVFVSASRADAPWPAALAAMASGVPMVVPRDSGLGDLVDAAGCGLAVRDPSPRDLGLAMGALLLGSATGRDELGAAGQRFARQHLGVDAAHAALLPVYWPDGRHVSRGWRAADGTQDGPVRLHLGCGLDRRHGWVNVDVSPAVQPDLVSRVDDLPMVADATVDEIEACHLFEHLALHEARQALREWARVLKPGGRLSLELPNLERSIGLIGTVFDEGGHDLGMTGVYGWPPDVEAAPATMAHRWGWTPATLTRELETAGFHHVEPEPVTQTYRLAARYDRDFRLTAVRRAGEEIR